MFDVVSRVFHFKVLCVLLVLSGCNAQNTPISLEDRDSEWQEVSALSKAAKTISAKDAPLLNKTYLYTGYYLGVPVMDFVVDFRARDGVYYARALTFTRGLLFYITRLKSDAFSFFSYNSKTDSYSPMRYHMEYSIRGKKREISMHYAEDGTLSSELIIPAVKEGEKISQALKDNAYDPFTATMVARQNVMNGKKAFSLPVYSGRTRVNMHVKNTGETNSKNMQKLLLTYTPKAGYTAEEIAEFKDVNFSTTMWFDPVISLITKGSAKALAARAKFSLKATCDTLKECINKR